MKKMKLVVVLLIALAMVSVPFAQDKEFKHAVQVNWVGLFTGNYGMNYELLLAQTHGIVAEGSFFKKGEDSGIGGGLGYRWHWSKKMNSGFLGLNMAFASIEGKVNNVSPFTLSVFAIKPNIGKRWIVGPGVSIVLRGGYGYASTNFDWAGGAVDTTLEKLFNFVYAFDGELSLGYSF